MRHSEGELEFDFSAAKRVEKLDSPLTPLPHGMALVDFVIEEDEKIRYDSHSFSDLSNFD